MDTTISYTFSKAIEHFSEAISALASSGFATQAKFCKLFQKFSESEEVQELYQTLWPSELKIADGIFKEFEGEQRYNRSFSVRPTILPAIPFHLADIPLRLIFESASPIDIVKFAMISPQSKDLVKSLRLPIKDLEMNYNDLTIQTSKSYSIYFYGGSFKPWNDVDRRRNWVCDTLSIEEKEITVTFNDHDQDQKNVYWFCGNRENSDYFHKLIKDLVLELFDVKAFSFIHNSKKETFKFLKANSEANYRNIVIRSLNQATNHEDFRLLMNINVYRMHFEFGSSEDVIPDYHGPLTPRKVRITQGQWLTTDHIWNMKTRYLFCYDSNFTAKQLNQFVKNWKNGGLKDLEYVFFDWSRSRRRSPPTPVSDYLDIATGIEATEWHAPINNEKLFADYDNSWDYAAFYLKNPDGVLATLKINPMAFEFHVRSGWDIDA